MSKNKQAKKKKSLEIVRKCAERLGQDKKAKLHCSWSKLGFGDFEQ
jgi:hypothetical protein